MSERASLFADRQVHAECDGFEVVRYERAGKWYVEPKGDRPREQVTISEAAMRALAAETLGGRIHTGTRGGMRFASEVKKNRPLVEWLHDE